MPLTVGFEGKEDVVSLTTRVENFQPTEIGQMDPNALSCATATYFYFVLFDREKENNDKYLVKKLCLTVIRNFAWCIFCLFGSTSVDAK